MNGTEKLLREKIDALLDLCDHNETPIICGMLEKQESKEMLVDLIVKKVVIEHFDIPDSIIAIENEFNPNAAE